MQQPIGSSANIMRRVGKFKFETGRSRGNEAHYSKDCARFGRNLSFVTSASTTLILLLLALAGEIWAADYPAPSPADYVIRNFQFQNGEKLPEVRMHFYTLGTPRRDEKGL